MESLFGDSDEEPTPLPKTSLHSLFAHSSVTDDLEIEELFNKSHRQNRSKSAITKSTQKDNLFDIFGRPNDHNKLSPFTSPQSTPESSVLPIGNINYETNSKVRFSSKPLEIEELKQANTNLQQKLTVAQDEILSLSSQVKRLEEQLKLQQEKEKEEAAEMEKMVALVEKNLEQANERANRAEAEVNRLRAEIVQNQRHASNGRSTDIQAQQLIERSQFAAHQIELFADGMDDLLKHLKKKAETLALAKSALLTQSVVEEEF